MVIHIYILFNDLGDPNEALGMGAYFMGILFFSKSSTKISLVMQ